MPTWREDFEASEHAKRSKRMLACESRIRAILRECAEIQCDSPDHAAHERLIALHRIDACLHEYSLEDPVFGNTAEQDTATRDARHDEYVYSRAIMNPNSEG